MWIGDELFHPERANLERYGVPQRERTDHLGTAAAVIDQRTDVVAPVRLDLRVNSLPLASMRDP